MANKPTVGIVINYYLPGQLTGGPVRTTSNLIEWLGDDISFKVMTRDRDKYKPESYPGIRYGTWQPVGKAEVRYLKQEDLRLWSFRKVLREQPFDLLYLDSVLGHTTILTLLLRRFGLIPRCPVIIPPRGHLDNGALSLKSNKKRIFLQTTKILGLYKGVNWHASGDTEATDIVREFGTQEKPFIRVLPNLPAPNLRVDPTKRPAKEPGTLNIVFLSRISRKKNLDYILTLLPKFKGRIEFHIYGHIEDPAYWEECKMLIQSLPTHIRATHHGVVNFDQVGDVFSRYDLFILPTLGENFGHVILESLCAGCPVLISDHTPWKDIPDHKAGWIVPLETPEEYINIAQRLVDMNEADFSLYRNQAYTYGSQRFNIAALVEATKQFLIETASQNTRASR